MNENIDKNVTKLRPFTKFLMTIGQLPTSYLMSMTYYEQIIWFTKYLQDQVIPAINNNAEVIEEIQEYLNNLDLQDEVDNKLDEMAEDGTLQEIIAEYLNSNAIFAFNNIADLKASSNLINGSYAKTLGYYSKNDGGSGLYKIRTKTNDDVIDEAFIVDLYNNLIAELIINDSVNVKQMGCYGDETHDDTTNMQKAFNSPYNVFINSGTYLITSTLYIPFNKKVSGEHRSNTKLKSTINSDYTIKYGTSYNYNGYKGIIENFTITSPNSNEDKAFGIYLYSGVTIKNMDFTYLSRAIDRIANYIDLINIENIYVAYCIPNSYYIIKLNGNGDAYYLRQIKFESYSEDTTEYNGIYIATCHGGELSDSILNCELNFYNVSAFSVNNCHMENTGRCINIIDSFIEFNNCFKLKNESNQRNDINITTSNYALYNNIILSNFIFEKNGNNYGNNFVEDINTIPVNTTLKLNNVCRMINFADKGTTTHITTGIFIKGNTEFNKLSGFYSKSSLITDELNHLPYYDNKVLPSNFGGTALNGNTKWLAPNESELHYRGIIVCDDVRKIATTYTNDSSISNVEYDGDCVGVVINNENIGKDMYLYRGSSINAYTKVCHVPNYGRTRLYDNGINVNGNPWETIESTNGTSLYNIVDKFVKIDDNVIVHKSSVPTLGTWKKGDKVINTSFNSNDDIAWVYDGTNWVSQGKY